MENHKKILGILYIVSGSLTMLVIFAIAMLATTIMALVAHEADPQDAVILELVAKLLQILPFIIVVFFSIPSIIAGIGLLYKQSWAMILTLILGCFKLFSFPLGTALGVYTIWVYVEDTKQSKQAF